MLIFQFVIFQVIIFTLVILALKKIMYSDTQGAVQRLEAAHEGLLEQQKELSLKIEAGEKEYHDKRQEAGRIAAKLKADALEEIREKEESIIKKAKETADDMVAKGREATDKYIKVLRRDLVKEQTTFVAGILRSALGEELVPILHREMIQDFLRRGRDFNLSGIPDTVNEADVKTAMSLTENERESLKSLIKEKVGRQLEINEIIDPTNIAGIKLIFGSIILDGSYATFVGEVAVKAKEKLEYQA